jgi:hypothetical protein
MAVQRALYAGLREHKAQAQNQRSGNYGAKTIRDVEAYQRLVGLNASGNVGLATLEALWSKADTFKHAGAFDDHGVQLLLRTKLGRPTRLDRGELKRGERGPHVAALQRMLWRVLGGDSLNTRGSTWGDRTTQDMSRFLNRANLERPATRCDQGTWEMLWAFGDDRAHKLARRTVVTPDDAIRQKVRSWGEWFVANRSRITYAQVRPYALSPHLPLRTDCSGSSTSILKWAGCPNDPHGRGWDGQGYTGTCYQRGTRISLSNLSELRPGDCVFYGDQGGGVPVHMGIVVGPGDRMLTFGHNPPYLTHVGTYWRSNLRTDVGARRYF